MSGKITIDLSEKNYSKLIKYLTDNNQKSLIKMIQSSRDDLFIIDKTSRSKKKERYEYYSGSAEEEEYEVEMDSLGRMSLM